MTTKGKIRWIWILVATLLGFMVAAGIVGELTPKAPVSTTTTTKGNIAAYVEERAQTSLPHIYHITMPMQGRVMPILVQEGEMVATGQIVVRLEDSDWRETAVEADKIIFAVNNWIKAATAQVKARKVQQDFAKWEYDKNQKLIKSSAVSEQQQRDSKRRFLDSNINVEESQAMLQATKAIKAIVDLMPPYVNRRLKRTSVKSPVSGTVLKRHVWNEKVMMPGAPLLDIGDLTQLEVSADILTEQAVRIQAGDRVEIFGESLGDEPLEGTVRLVEPEGFNKISSLGVEEQRVTVKIAFAPGMLEKLKNFGKTLGLHYRLRVRVITAEKRHVLTVPRTTLFRGSNGNWQVYRVVRDRAVLTDVRVGLMNDLKAEISSGIKEGDTIIIAPESSISNGTRVASMD